MWELTSVERDMLYSPDADVALLRKSVEWVEEQEQLAPGDPERTWYQKSYIVRMDEARRQGLVLPGEASQYSCGTAYCVAGKVALDDGWQPLNDQAVGVMIVEKDGVWSQPPNVARDLLGLDSYQAGQLFAGTNSAERIRAVAEAIAGEPL